MLFVAFVVEFGGGGGGVGAVLAVEYSRLFKAIPARNYDNSER